MLGGKRAARSQELYDINPCFCLSGIGNCTLLATGELRPRTFVTPHLISTLTHIMLVYVGVQVTNGSCPMDRTAVCNAVQGEFVGREVSVVHDTPFAARPTSGYIQHIFLHLRELSYKDQSHNSVDCSPLSFYIHGCDFLFAWLMLIILR